MIGHCLKSKIESRVTTSVAFFYGNITPSFINMNKLPKEVLISIIEYLEFIDKLTCLRVCKQLYEAITIDLYKVLEFYDLQQAQDAMAMFKTRGKLGHRTSNLTIDRLDLGKELVLCLPLLLPNIKSLNWREDDSNRKKQNNLLNDMDTQQLSNWKHLEKIVDRPHKLHISTKLLGVCTFNNLKCLQVSFADCSMFKYDEPNRSHITQLLSNIKNAPNLKQLTISESVIDLGDMEIIHSSLPHLQELSLDVVYVLADNPVTVTTMASGLTSFSLSFAKLGNLSVVEITDILIDWIRYMGQKYTRVQHFKFGHDLLDTSSYESDQYDAPAYESDLLEQPLVETLFDMPNIKSYAVQATAMTSNILDVICSSCHQLTNLQLYLDNNTQMKYEFGLLPAYCQTMEKIESLTISRISCGKIEGVLLGQTLSDLADARLFCNLVSLKLENILNNGQVVLVNILKSFPMLEKLHVNQLGFRSPNLVIPLDTIYTCRIKELNLYVWGEQKAYPMEILNLYFDFVLQSCPQLERFSLSGDLNMYCPGDTFYLIFPHDIQLKYISIKLYQCHYYTFNNQRRKEGKRWIDYFKPLQDNIQDKSYHTHLAWRGRVVPDLINIFY